MLSDYRSEKYSNHASNLGAILAERISTMFQCPSFIIDPVTSDDFIPEARISGVPKIERKSRSHALNIKYCVRKTENELDIPINSGKFVVAHLGSGFSIASVNQSKIIDVNDALLGMGPFSIERAGSIPLQGLIDLVFKKKLKEAELKELLSKNSGLMGYINTRDLRQVENKIESNQQAKLIYNAMVYQITKEIGGMYASLNGHIEGLILTGGLCNSDNFVSLIKQKNSFISNIFVYPGSFELEALVEGGLAVLNNPDICKTYQA
jgi:butyrate kinase